MEDLTSQLRAILTRRLPPAEAERCLSELGHTLGERRPVCRKVRYRWDESTGRTVTLRRVGKVSDFPVGNFVEVTFLNASPVPWSGVTAKQAAWLRRGPNDHFTALTIYCQHLGCPVRWEPGSQLFFCPCHGGVYYASGAVAAGPPERALPPYQTRVRNGQVEIKTAEIPYP